MTPTQELIKDLKAAIDNKQEHNQKLFFNECGTAACIAGQKVTRDIENKIIKASECYSDTGHYSRYSNCWGYSRKAYGLSDSMADLIFNENANYLCHQLAVKLLELGLENKLTDCQYMDKTIYTDIQEDDYYYSNPDFSLSLYIVKENTEDTLKLLTTITKEIGANLHRRDLSNQFLIEKGLDLKFNDIQQLFLNGEE